eukprot:scaffold251717_cov28-Tisochrysis_lutea.AAC.1
MVGVGGVAFASPRKSLLPLHLRSIETSSDGDANDAKPVGHRSSAVLRCGQESAHAPRQSLRPVSLGVSIGPSRHAGEKLLRVDRASPTTLLITVLSSSRRASRDAPSCD